METVDIKIDKKGIMPMLAILAITLIGITYYFYFSGKFRNDNTMDIVLLLLSVPLWYIIYTSTNDILSNKPVLIFSESEIVINKKGKRVTFLWAQVIDWKIENVQIEQGGSHSYLTIETVKNIEKINISYLDKTPFEIKILLHTYKANKGNSVPTNTNFLQGNFE